MVATCPSAPIDSRLQLLILTALIESITVVIEPAVGAIHRSGSQKAVVLMSETGLRG